MNYFPSATSDTWTYNNVPSNAPSGLTTVTTTSPVAFKGYSGAIERTISNTAAGATTYSQYFLTSAGGLTYLGNSVASDQVDNLSAPYAQLLYPVKAGPVSSLNARNIPFGTTASGDPIVSSFTQTMSVAEIGTVATSAGVFTNAAKAVQAVVGTATDTKTGVSVPYTETDTTWLAPAVGVVQNSSVVTINGTTSTITTDLRGYVVGGVPKGLGDPATFVASAFNDQYLGPAVATDGTNSFIVIGTPNALTGFLLDANGNLIANVPLNTSAAYWYMVAFDGSNYEVASYATGGSEYPTNPVYVQRVTSAGVLMDPAPGYLAGTQANAIPFPVLGASMAAGSNNLLIVIAAQTQTNAPSGQLSGLFVNPSGVPSPTGVFSIQAINYGVGNSTPPPKVAFDGTNFLVVWSQNPDASGGASIYGVRVSPTGSVIDSTPIVISTASPISQSPSVAFDGTNYLVVWGDNRNSNGTYVQIYGNRLTPSGGLLDGPANGGGILLSSNAPNSSTLPAVAFSRSEYFVAWLEGGAGTGVIRGARLSPSGTLLSGQGFEIGVSGPSSTPPASIIVPPALAFTPSSGLAVWFGSNIPNTQLGGVVVHPF